MATEGGLDRRVQNLPQELQDEILDHVLFIKPGEVALNTIDYKPPCQLQINRATRKKAAKHYYGASTLTIRDKRYPEYVVEIWWLQSLTAEHQSKIVDIRGDYRSGEHTVPGVPSLDRVAVLSEAKKAQKARKISKGFSHVLRKKGGVALGDGVLKSNYFYVVGAAGTDDARVVEGWVSELGVQA